VRRTGFPKDVVELILTRSGGNCEIIAEGCKLAADQIHHRRPRAMGGTLRPETNTASNGLACCRTCHNRTESFRNWAKGNGFIVSQHLNPATVPVWWRCSQDGYGKRLVLLDDVGGKTPVTEGQTA
jgi:5-methylcytosine-specific restriction protein A